VLVATSVIGGDSSLAEANTFLLDRRTGLGIWSKVRSKAFMSPFPEAQTHNFVCEAQ
jgi:hypothetical protein